jgi:hypothetical protein
METFDENLVADAVKDALTRISHQRCGFRGMLHAWPLIAAQML